MIELYRLIETQSQQNLINLARANFVNGYCGCLHRTGMFEIYNRVKTIIVFTDVYLVDNMYNVET